MAYGKNPNTLQAAGGSFRQRANAYSQHRDEQRSRGGGGAPFFVGQYKPSLNDADTIRILEGHHKVKEVVGEGDQAQVREVDLPFFPWTEHYDGRNKKSAVCSAGPFAGNKKKSDPCHGCSIHFETREVGADGKKKSERMSRRDMFAFSVLDYSKYHKMPQIDRQTGQISRNDKGEAYYNWVKCDGVGCDGCKAGVESQMGQTLHWSMGWGHYQVLLSADETIGKSCVSCGGYETIDSLAWTCPHCGDAIIDMRTTSLKAAQVQETSVKEFRCNCGFQGFLNEIITCRQCSPSGGTAKRATIFDVDMQVKRVETSNGGGKQTNLMIVRTSAPRPVQQNFAQFAKPKPLEKIYAPTPLETQATQFGVTASNRQPRSAADIASNAPGQQPGPMTQPPGFGPPPGGGFPMPGAPMPSQQAMPGGYPAFPGVPGVVPGQPMPGMMPPPQSAPAAWPQPGFAPPPQAAPAAMPMGGWPQQTAPAPGFAPSPAGNPWPGIPPKQ